MTTTFPFEIEDVRAWAVPERQYRITAAVSELDEYYVLFEKYGFGGNGPCWVEHITTIIEEHQPALLDQLDFDEEGDAFVVYADSETSTQQFLRLVQPIFADLGALNKYLSQTDPADFFE